MSVLLPTFDPWRFGLLLCKRKYQPRVGKGSLQDLCELVSVRDGCYKKRAKRLLFSCFAYLSKLALLARSRPNHNRTLRKATQVRNAVIFLDAQRLNNMYFSSDEALSAQN